MKTGVFFEEESSGFGAIYAVYKAGGLYEKKGFRGISHLAEHLKCKKEKEFNRFINVNNIDTNAFTDDDCVCFYCKGGDHELSLFAASYIKECLTYVPTEQEFLEEKSIILQEYDSYLNDYAMFVSTGREVSGFYGPIGNREDIEKITYKKFKLFYVEHFSNPTCVVLVGGNEMKAAYESLKSCIKLDKRTTKVKLPVSKFINKVVTVKVKRNADAQILISKVDRKKCGFSELSLRFFVNLMSDGFFSPMMQNIRETHGLCYSLGYSVESYKDLLVFLSTETSKWKNFRNVYLDMLNRFDVYVSQETYEDYVSKLVCKFRHTRMKPSDANFILRKYVKDESLLLSFDSGSLEYSYATMRKIALYLAKKAEVQTIVHHGEKINFSTF